jgi:2-polyprenyl-3-methyl-5-hydroxy-6-metoxy-1,4-benzoquinol methylase
MSSIDSYNAVDINPDEIWSKILVSKGEDKKLVNDLHLALIKNIHLSKLFVIFKYVKQLIKDDKSIRILDYGCGGGQLLT